MKDVIQIGMARVDMTPAVGEMGMMGWGMFHNVVEDVESPIQARALFLEDPETGRRLCIVCVDLCFVSQSMHQQVLECLDRSHRDLGLTRDELVITATHTHSAPGGYSHHVLYNLTIPGFVPEVLEAYVGGVVTAIVLAHERRRPGRVRMGVGEFDPAVPVAFNRALEAYNTNPEVRDSPVRHPHLALDRRMVLLRFDDLEGRPIGVLNWFAVHGTSVHSDQCSVSSDNKGAAARFLESHLELEHPALPTEPVAIFAQGAAGDVTPNFWHHPGKPHVRGIDPDDFLSAAHNGTYQFEQAREIFHRLETSRPIEAELDGLLRFVDFSDVDVDPAFTGGLSSQRTGPGAIGVSMVVGTAEGPGMPPAVGRVVNALYRGGYAALRMAFRCFPGGFAKALEEMEIQGEKAIFVSTGRRRVMGIRDLRYLPLPALIHPVIAQIKEMHARGLLEPAWTPQVLPIQIARIGPLAIAVVPGEFTTIAGRRLAATVHHALEGTPVERVQICGYANAYAGYVTTREEYALQGYEGGSTHFGKWTLAAYQTRFADLAGELRKPHEARSTDPGPSPHRFAAEDLERRSFTSIRGEPPAPLK